MSTLEIWHNFKNPRWLMLQGIQVKNIRPIISLHANIFTFRRP